MQYRGAADIAKLNKCPSFMKSAWVKLDAISLPPIITIILHDDLTSKARAGLSFTQNNKTGVGVSTLVHISNCKEYLSS